MTQCNELHPTIRQLKHFTIKQKILPYIIRSAKNIKQKQQVKSDSALVYAIIPLRLTGQK
jgi:hypothetical protein